MPEFDPTPIWNRIDQHGNALQEHQVSLKVAERRMDQHEGDIRRISHDMAAQHTSILAKVDEWGRTISEDLKELRDDYHQRQGAKQARMQGSVDFKIALGIIGAVLTLITVVYMMAGQ